VSDPSVGPVAVILVNWNGRAHLATCLAALASQTYADHSVVVVDNASTDGSVAWLERDWPDVHVLALPENVGFAAANNRAIAVTVTPWVALLNNDTAPEPDWLAALVATAAAGGPRLASVASRMVFMAEPHILNSTGIAVDAAGIAWDRLGGAPAEAGNAPSPVFGASAGAALFRRAALDDVAEPVRSGPVRVFDESFFMYLEDVDLAWRLRLRDWSSEYAPAAWVRHHGSASAGEGSPFKNRLLARNKVWTLVKNYPTVPMLPRLPLIVAYDLASAPYRLLVQGQSAALRGRLDALAGLAEPLACRRRIQARRTTSWERLQAALSPVEPPWAVLRRYQHLTGKQTPPSA
jgi:GT2 family glycosyltransferase